MNSSSLSVGDVVSAGLRIYRDRFKDYFPIAIIAALWLIVPFCVLILFISAWTTYFQNNFPIAVIIVFWFIIFIYCLAKYFTAAGLISRLAFGEIIEKPESVTEARNQVNPLMWTFLLGSLRVFLFFLGLILVAMVIIGILFFIASLAPFFAPLLLLGQLGLWISYLWLFARLYLVELIIGIEKTGTTRALDRSWLLTEPFVVRLILIIFIALLITIPIYFAVNFVAGYVVYFFVGIVYKVFGAESAVVNVISFLFSLAFNILSVGITMPFWQSIKAAIYYDLRSKREGIDLL
jgi:hypothetical protein